MGSVSGVGVGIVIANCEGENVSEGVVDVVSMWVYGCECEREYECESVSVCVWECQHGRERAEGESEAEGRVSLRVRLRPLKVLADDMLAERGR